MNLKNVLATILMVFVMSLIALWFISRIIMGEAKENINVQMRLQSVQHASITIIYTDDSHETIEVQKWVTDNGWLNFVEKTGGAFRVKNTQFIKELVVVPDDPEFRPKPIVTGSSSKIEVN